MSRDKLWSPQMRKWAKDAPLHGIPIGFAYKGVPHREVGWEGGTAMRVVQPAPAGAGVMFMNVKVAALTILNFGKKRGIFRIQ